MLTFKEFSDANYERCRMWHDPYEWTLSDWGVAVAGECGEMCNVIKKINRHDASIPGNKESIEELQDMLSDEIADTLTYLFLLAVVANLDMEKIVIKKFNEVSDKHGFGVKL